MSIFLGCVPGKKEGEYWYHNNGEYYKLMQGVSRYEDVTLDILKGLMREYPDKKDALQHIYNEIYDILYSDRVLTEELIEVRGMSKILYDLYSVLGKVENYHIKENNRREK